MSLIFINAADFVFLLDADAKLKLKRFVDVLINPCVVYNLSTKKE